MIDMTKDISDMSKEELLKLLETIKANLAASEDANDFCIWLAETLEMNVWPGV